MDSGMFYGMKGPLKLKSEKAWFDAMNEIYKTTNPYRQLAEKLGCKVYKEGVGLFVWAKLIEYIGSRFIDRSCMKSILLHRNYLG
jgi:hypothetical protein